MSARQWTARRRLKFGGWGSENLIGGLDEVFVSKKGVALAEEDIQLLMENGWESRA